MKHEHYCTLDPSTTIITEILFFFKVSIHKRKVMMSEKHLWVYLTFQHTNSS